MTLQQIQQAKEAGHTIHWCNDSYTVVKSKRGEFFINHISGSCIGLTWLDGSTLNGDESDFYIG
jgi:hypothetical protein